MDDKKKVLVLGTGILVVLAAALAVYLFFFRPGGGKPPEAGITPAKTAEKESLSADIPVFPTASLDDSDTLIRQLARELTSIPDVDSWLPSSDVIRKITAAVDAVAEGRSPVKQVDFFFPSEKFKVLVRGGREYLDPASYERYTPAAEAFISYNVREGVRFYRGLKPLFQEAYRELGYPDRDFDGTLRQALLELLAVPVVEGEVRLEKKVKTYMFSDPALESLSEAQKHFLRMGPANVAPVQIKLREMALALGLAAADLPPPRTVTAR